MDKILKKINDDVDSIRVVKENTNKIEVSTNFIGLKKGEFTLNNGSTIIREGVYKKTGSGNAVCLFAVTTDKKILIVIQPRVELSTKNKINIELPAGYIEEGESSVESGIRELLEETGYTSNDVTLVDSYYTSLGISGERIDLLLALDCIKVDSQHLDKDEFLYYELVTLEEFEYLLNNNYIMDANARIGYYRYLEYLMKEGY